MLREESVIKLKKALSTLFVISCLLSVSSLINQKISVKASPTTWTVDDDGPADFNNIQEAVNNASSGDTIIVRMGTYYEHVVINKSIALIGENRDLTIVDGSKTNYVISIRADNVSVNSFTLRKSGIYPYSGISIDHCMGNAIINNKVIGNYEGISLYYSSSNVISGNVISSNNDGIYLYSSSSNVISGNVISSNSEGICLYSSSNNVVSNNTIDSSTYDGIYLHSSSNNVVSNNLILRNNYQGISLYFSSNNAICGNTISSNANGIRLALSSNNNTIYHNNFNNTDQVWTDSTNIWIYNDEGNYWSGYTGQDLNGDGIGDEPYVIDENNKDNNPLLGIFSDFNVSLERETYRVTIISNSTISDFNFEFGIETGNKIIRFNVTDKDDTVGFSRVTIPIELMKYPYIVLVDGIEVSPVLLNISDKTKVCLYFTYSNKNSTIRIICPETLYRYYELLAKYFELKTDLNNLSEAMNATYQKHLLDYSEQMQNIRSLMYIFASTTAVFIATTIYLSKRVHERTARKSKGFEGE
jgi:parallel beta-helix repeat protein